MERRGREGGGWREEEGEGGGEVGWREEEGEGGREEGGGRRVEGGGERKERGKGGGTPAQYVTTQFCVSNFHSMSFCISYHALFTSLSVDPRQT